MSHRPFQFDICAAAPKHPNPLKQAYKCQTCGAPRLPYQLYCDQHLEDGERKDWPLLIDRIMKRLFGRS